MFINVIAWPAVKAVLVLKTQPPLLLIECFPASEATNVCAEDLESWGIVRKLPFASDTVELADKVPVTLVFSFNNTWVESKRAIWVAKFSVKISTPVSLPNWIFPLPLSKSLLWLPLW